MDSNIEATYKRNLGIIDTPLRPPKENLKEYLSQYNRMRRDARTENNNIREQCSREDIERMDMEYNNSKYLNSMSSPVYLTHGYKFNWTSQ